MPSQTPTAEYNRLAVETYSDAAYQDRLQLAYNKMMDAQDARVTTSWTASPARSRRRCLLRKAQANLDDAKEMLAEAKAGGDKLALANAKVGVYEAQVALADSARSADRAGRRRGCE